MVKKNGSSTEIENAVSTLPGVKECACVPKPDKIMGQLPCLFITWNSEAKDSHEVRAMLKKKLEMFKIPQPGDIYTVDALPRTVGTGKGVKRLLLENISENLA